jgi:hypothetical protein
MVQDRDETEKRRLANFFGNGNAHSRDDSQFQSVGDLLRTATKGKPKPPKVKKRALPIIPWQTKPANELPPPSGEDFTNRQLYLFQKFLANTDDDRDSLSNAIDLWDSVPRYSVSRQAMNKVRIQGRFLDKHEMTFEHRNHSYTRIISPARITDEDGVDRDYYPSASEELVEDALRKIATEQQAGYFDRPNYRSGVAFTLHMLREEMKRRGHTRSYQEIVQSLNILSHSVIEIRPHATGEAKIVAPCIPSLAAVSRNQLLKDPKSRWVVQFHPLVTGAIDNLTYRQFNYRLMMSHKTQLARWLHKQLVLKYTFAGLMNPFEMRYSTVKRDSGLLDEYGRSRDALDKLEEAFEELKQRNVILTFTRRDVTGMRKAIVDAIFTVRPNMEFVTEAKAANRRLGDAKAVPSAGR